MSKKLSERYLKYINSSKWRKKRQDLFEVRGKRCEICGATKNIHVHHLTYENFENEKLEDLKVLCEYHHNIYHGINPNKKIKNKYKPNFKKCINELKRYDEFKYEEIQDWKDLALHLSFINKTKIQLKNDDNQYFIEYSRKELSKLRNKIKKKNKSKKSKKKKIKNKITKQKEFIPKTILRKKKDK